MTPSTETRSPKRPYQPPRLRTIEIAADEVLAVGCKTSGGSINVGVPGCGIYNSCATEGS